MTTSSSEQILFFDGYCTICNSSVNLLMRLDKQRVFKYASLQSRKAEELLNKLHEIGMDSVVLYKEQKIYTESDALAEIALSLSWPWRFFNYIKYLPKPLRDWGYRLVANNRYLFFRKRNECRIPTEEERSLFYD